MSNNLHLIVKQHEGGFFSNFNKIVTFLSECTDEIVKISWNLQGQPYGAFAYDCGEVFGKVFNNFTTAKSIDKVNELVTYSNFTYTGKNVHDVYTSNDLSWRHSFNSCLCYFNLTNIASDLLNQLTKQMQNKKIISVLKRNELLKCEQINNRLPTLDTYFKQIDCLYDNSTYLYLSVDNVNDLNAFISRYGKCIYNPKMRRSNFNTDTEPHFTPGTYLDAIYTYMEVVALSRGSHFIHPISNMATSVLYHNPYITSIYI